MEGLEFHGVLVDPLSSAGCILARVKLCVEGQQMQVDGLVANIVYSLLHVLDKHTVGRSCTVDAYHHLRLLEGVFLLFLGARLTLLKGFLIAVDGIIAQLVVGHDRCCQESLQSASKRLSVAWVADDVYAVVQPALFFRTMVEVIPCSGHVGTEEGSCCEGGSGIVLKRQTTAYLSQAGIDIEERGYLLSPFTKRQLGKHVLHIIVSVLKCHGL